jgi:hypothetical protein
VAALEAEIAAYVDWHRDEHDGDGQALVVRWHGPHPEERARSRDDRGERAPRQRPADRPPRRPDGERRGQSPERLKLVNRTSHARLTDANFTSAPATDGECMVDLPPNDDGQPHVSADAPGWNRTSDPLLRRQVLYPLSYEGTRNRPDSSRNRGASTTERRRLARCSGDNGRRCIVRAERPGPPCGATRRSPG